ncbi:TIGR03545 family protein [Reinekea marina]|uniref:TIGR03545 family protein n=1 Tax=Reinekea marina TaxID=1310421 RepID=A0ABV7WTA1_9GAMM|nr:TIGR03545 family protein [Reinekea marina]MDN3649206.1 TIGR03545 family protein [Reinekea marina]
MKLFRISGLIGFVVFSALLLVVGFLFIDVWAKKGIELSATNINGAEVNVDDVDLTLSPIGFRIEKIQVTDKAKPSHNRLVIEQAVLDINLAQLFLGRVRINDMHVVGLATNVERSQPGKLVEKPAEESSAFSEASEALVEDRKESLGSAFPSPSEVVADSTAETKAAIANAQLVINNAKSTVEASAAKLPGEDDLAEYQRKISALKAQKIDSLESVKQMQTGIQGLTKQVATDKLAIEKLKLSIDLSVKQAKEAVSNIKDAPAKDWQTLLSKNPINAETAIEVSKILLGEELVNKFEQYQGYYETAQPWLKRLSKLRGEKEAEDPSKARLDGTYIRFEHPDPTPNFLIDRGGISFDADGWPWQVEMTSVTGEQTITGKPAEFSIKRGEGDNTAMQVGITIDRREPTAVDTINMIGRGIAFSKQTASVSGADLTWSPAPANLDGNIVVTDGELNGQITLSFDENTFDYSGASKADEFIKKALAQVTEFKVFIDVTGKALKPSIAVSSTLDNQVGEAFSAIAKAEYEKWLDSVRAQLEAEVAKLRAPVDEKLGSVVDLQQQAKQKADEFEQKVVAQLKELEDKLTAEMKRLEEQASAAVAAELKAAQEKIAAEKARLEAERKAAEAAAKKAAEEKAKEELEKLKGKLKF